MKRATQQTLIAFTAVLLLAPRAAPHAAELKLATLFSNHMVLQRDMPVPVWGWPSLQPFEKDDDERKNLDGPYFFCTSCRKHLVRRGKVLFTS
jgi:hypothetical protein